MTEAAELLEEMQEVSDAFYQNQKAAGIKRLPELIRKLSEYVSHLEPEQQRGCLASLQGVMEAMEAGQYIMLADMLVFDMGDAVEAAEQGGRI